MQPIAFTRVKNDTDGNPRYVCHFLDMDVHGNYAGLDLRQRYALACKLANTIGGRKYRNKSYGGGIVFQSYALDETVSAIARVTGKPFAGYVVE